MEYAHTENSFQCRYATGEDGQNNARRPRCGGEAASIGNRFGFADYRGNASSFRQPTVPPPTGRRCS
jgi:hypothetical protein